MLKSIIPSLSLIMFSSFIASYDAASAMDEGISEFQMNQCSHRDAPPPTARPRKGAEPGKMTELRETAKLRKPSFQPTLSTLTEKEEQSKTLASPRKRKPKSNDSK